MAPKKKPTDAASNSVSILKQLVKPKDQRTNKVRFIEYGRSLITGERQFKKKYQPKKTYKKGRKKAIIPVKVH